MDRKAFERLPLLGILRGIREPMVEPIMETVCAAGLAAIEVTMNTAGAPRLLKSMVRAAKERLSVGAGTVLTPEELEQALDAGASFIVLPVLVEEVVSACVQRRIPVFPGALTPGEIHRAWRAGATMVKVFPAGLFGPAYLREIRGPFQDLKLLACGGITPENVGDFFSGGASAAAFGGSVFRREWLESGAYERIGESLDGLVRGYRDWKSRPP